MFKLIVEEEEDSHSQTSCELSESLPVYQFLSGQNFVLKQVWPTNHHHHHCCCCIIITVIIII